MTRFDVAEVRDFTADIATRMNGCQIVEGMECAGLDLILRRHADACREFCDQARQWGDAVFAGRVVFDPEVERLWREEGRRLHSQASQVLRRGRDAEERCYDLGGQALLGADVDHLERLLSGWVSPRLAISPAARLDRIPEYRATEEGRRRVASLPPLPVEWRPDEQDRQELHRELRSS